MLDHIVETLQLWMRGPNVLRDIFTFLAIISGYLMASRNIATLRDGQITDRLSKAVEQLGSNKLEVRVGAVFLLERIARNSAADHWPVMEILSAFIREHCRSATTECSDDATGPIARQDLQAALTVIGRRRPKFDSPRERLDLSNTNLSAADLHHARLDDAWLEKADLRQAEARGANLKGASLVDADLRNANFRGAYLRNAHLRDSDLRGTNLCDADLSYADLRRTLFDQNTQWFSANLKGAMFSYRGMEELAKMGLDVIGRGATTG